MKLTLQQSRERLIYIFPTFKPEIKVEGFTISFTAEVLAAIRHPGITVKSFIATPYIPQKAIVTAGNLYTGKKSV